MLMFAAVCSQCCVLAVDVLAVDVLYVAVNVCRLVFAVSGVLMSAPV